MEKQKEELIKEVLDLIPVNMFPKGIPISEKLRLEKDLGIYGDDAVDFILKFSEKFNVDLANFDFSKYFTKEIYFR